MQAPLTQEDASHPRQPSLGRASARGISSLGETRRALENVDDTDERPGKYDKFAVPIVFVIFVVMRAMDRVFLKRVQNIMNSSAYNLILMNLIWPMAMLVPIMMAVLGYIGVMKWKGDTRYNLRFFLPGNPLATSGGTIYLYQLALFSFWDQVNATMSAPPGSYISLPMQSLMSNLPVMWTMGLAFFYLRTRFHQVHIIGCTLIMISCVVGLADKLESNDCSESGMNAGQCLTAYKTGSGEFKEISSVSMILWYSLFILSTVPLGISNVYKQSVLQAVDLDVFYAFWWASVFQVVWGWLFFWVNWVPFPDQTPSSPSDTLPLLSETWACFTGAVACPEQTHASGPWHSAMFWFGIYMCFNLFFNVLFYWLTKRMSATWAQVATTLCLDLTNIFSQSSALMGKGAEIMTVCQWLATLIASVALWTYNLEPEKHRDSDGKTRVSANDAWQAPSMVSDGHASLVQCLSFRPEKHPGEQPEKQWHQAAC